MALSSTGKKRLTKHDLKEDRFVTAMYRLSDYAGERRGTLTIAVLALVAVVVAIGLYQRSSHTGSSRAEEILYVALSDYDGGRFAEAGAGLGEFLDRYPHHRRAAIAALALGNTHLAQGEMANAQASFAEAVKKSERGSTTWVSAKCGLGTLAQAQGQSEQAVSHFMEAANATSSKELQGEALISAARVQLETGNTEAARDAIERVRRDCPQTRASSMIPVLEGRMAAVGL